MIIAKMKRFVLICLLLLVMPIINAHRDYNKGSYGSGLYGVNTPPTNDAFQPTDVTPIFNLSTNVTFNLTFSDDDGDILTLHWEVNRVQNITNGKNLSFVFNKVGVFNITGNVSDNLNSFQQEWLVTIINDTTVAAIPHCRTFNILNISSRKLLISVDCHGKIIITSTETKSDIGSYLCIASNGEMYKKTTGCDV